MIPRKSEKPSGASETGRAACAVVCRSVSIAARQTSLAASGSPLATHRQPPSDGAVPDAREHELDRHRVPLTVREADGVGTLHKVIEAVLLRSDHNVWTF